MPSAAQWAATAAIAAVSLPAVADAFTPAAPFAARLARPAGLLRGAGRTSLVPAMTASGERISEQVELGLGDATGSGAAQQQPEGEGSGAVCFDGGCMAMDPSHSQGMDMLDAELKDLGEVERRLRREGALMLLEKLRAQDGDLAPPVTSTDTPPPAQSQSIIAKRLAGRSGPTVWSEFGALAAKTKGINLGQGFPNWSPPDFVVDAAVQAVSQGGAAHQYTRTAGHPPLCALLAARYSMHLGRNIVPETEVAVTVGASQALFITLQTLVEQGDEVVLFEPFFDLYIGQIRLAGGTPTYCPLQPNGSKGFELDVDLLRSKVTPKTKVLILNSPHNPTGKVFTSAEMEAIAQVVRENPQITVISDEVYKYVIHSDSKKEASVEDDKAGGIDSGSLGSAGHVHFAKLDGMWDRTLTVASAGKTFSVTGWQVGWVIGPARMVKDVQTMLPFVQFCASTPMQEALVSVLKQADQPYNGEGSYYEWLRKGYVAKRDALAAALRSAGIEPMQSEGGFFLVGDTSGLTVPDKYMEETTPAMPSMTRDWALCRWFALEHGIVAIPCSPFYSPENRDLGKDLVRFAFCKTDDTLKEAYEAFSKIPQN